MNITCKKNETLGFYAPNNKVILSYHGMEYQQAYFHVLANDRKKAMPFYSTHQQQLVLGCGGDAITLEIVGFTQQSCTFYADLPKHIVLTQCDYSSAAITQLENTRVEHAKNNLMRKVKSVLVQQLRDNSKNIELLLETITALREIVEEIEIDIHCCLKKEKQLINSIG